MIKVLDRSAGPNLGFTVSGDVMKSDYDVLTSAVRAAVEAEGSVNLVLDMTSFHWEKVGAWGADLHFGHEFHDKINRMAIVGDKKWEEHLAHLASPLYAKDSDFFPTTAGAWTWVENQDQPN